MIIETIGFICLLETPCGTVEVDTEDFYFEGVDMYGVIQDGDMMGEEILINDCCNKEMYNSIKESLDTIL